MLKSFFLVGWKYRCGAATKLPVRRTDIHPGNHRFEKNTGIHRGVRRRATLFLKHT